MDAEWLASANAALQTHADYAKAGQPKALTTVVAGQAPPRPWLEDGPFGGWENKAPRLEELLALPEPHNLPFRRMLTHPAVAARLQWMLGSGWVVAAAGPRAIVSGHGGAGVYLHAGGYPIDPTGHYTNIGGRAHVGYINVAWTLHDVTEADGGFCAIAGSHKARRGLPGAQFQWVDRQGYGLSADPAPLLDSGHLRHVPMPAGSVILFMGAAQTHGAFTWRGQQERRVVLLGVYSRHFAGANTAPFGARM